MEALRYEGQTQDSRPGRNRSANEGRLGGTGHAQEEHHDHADRDRHPGRRSRGRGERGALLLRPAAECFGLPATIVGTGGEDELQGTPEADVIVGKDGNDEIDGNGGDDRICGNGGNDDLDVGELDEEMTLRVARASGNGSGPDSGSDMIAGGNGRDFLFGGQHEGEENRLQGDDGKDDVFSGGSDDMSGGADRDLLLDLEDEDDLFGGGGDDEIDAQDEASDTVRGNGGKDECIVDTEAPQDDVSGCERPNGVNTNSVSHGSYGAAFRARR